MFISFISQKGGREDGNDMEVLRRMSCPTQAGKNVMLGKHNSMPPFDNIGICLVILHEGMQYTATCLFVEITLTVYLQNTFMFLCPAC